MKIRFLLSILLSFCIHRSFSPASLESLWRPMEGRLYFHAEPVEAYLLSSQVRVRLFTEFSPDNAIFTVKSGKYLISNGTGRSIAAREGEPVIIARYNEKIYVKERNGEAFIGDSVVIKGLTGDDYFSLQVIEAGSLKRNYSGDLKCFSDMETLLLINTCDIEKYIAGVVEAEGGSGKNEEYFRTQAVIARTYTYKYFSKHIIDRYNLCDNTHCQAFNGLIEDSLIISAVLHTRGLVITTPDSVLIISAFHSNCGGETSPSQYAWLTGQPYLTRVVDPYCQNSRNALWERKISLKEWTDFLKRNGYSGILSDPSVFNFNQTSRVPDYVAASFSMSLRTLRTNFDFRSSYFSVLVEGDSLLINGKGYGHGVGLCQEGAMAMAVKGFTYQQIIDFYYSGVLIMDIKNAVLLPKGLPPNPPEGGLKSSKNLSPL
jgi:stage II sporulation protein D